jgi:hypothetical protein
LTSALVGGERSASRSGRLTSGKEATVLIKQEAGWAPEPVWRLLRREKSLAPTGKLMHKKDETEIKNNKRKCQKSEIKCESGQHN